MEFLPTDHYFEDVLPDYSSECLVLGTALIFTIVFWVIVFPYASSKILCGFNSDVTNSASATGLKNEKERAAPNKKVSSGSTRQRKGKDARDSRSASLEKAAGPSNSKFNEEVSQDTVIPLPILALASLGCMVSVFWVTMTMSPYNTFVARGVFEVPMLTAEECEKLLNISYGVAARNSEEAHRAKEAAEIAGEAVNKSVKGLLYEPIGWQKHRHGAYPTTDLNIITDPFSRADLDWLQTKLDARLAPTLSRIYGIPESSIRANDMFVVRYDSDYRAHLSNHTDDADISINILLTDTFEGGGTQFWNRQTGQPFAHVQPKRVGQMLTHSALINHEGMQTTQGTRIIFVGFLSVDRIDPFSDDENPRTKLSVFASWLSLPWISTKFKEAYSSAHHRRKAGVDSWKNNKYMMALFLDMANALQIVGDYFAPHHVQNLVSDKHADQHLRTLDEIYLAKKVTGAQGGSDRASWFAGQQIDLDIDGHITNEWSTRRDSKNRFMEL